MLESLFYPPTGVPQIDAEHRAIAELVEKIYSAADAEEGDAVALLAIELERMVAEHFATEERLMDAIGYPDRERHRRAHRQYLAGARAQVAALAESGVTPLLLRWCTNLDLWFRSHVLDEDLWLGTALVDAGRRP